MSLLIAGACHCYAACSGLLGVVEIPIRPVAVVEADSAFVVVPVEIFCA